MMQKKEHLLHYMMKGHVHLSKKDYGFFNNLTYIIREKNQVTSNQNKLFDKLILKYQRQLRKLNHFNIDTLCALDWDVEVVDSKEEYLTPKLYLESNELCLRTPFNSNFVRSFKLAKDNTFIWNKDQRIYRSPFYTHSLRLAYDTCYMFFDKLDISDDLMTLINPLLENESKTKVPILTTNQGKYYIDNMNKNLAEAVKDIELNDDPKTLYKLSRYGVAIDQDIIGDDPIKLFASQYITKIDLDELFDKIDCFKKLDITEVHIPAKHTGGIDTVIRTFLKNEGINIVASPDDMPDGAVFIKRIMGPERLNMMGVEPRKIGKFIHITNSRPIEVK